MSDLGREQQARQQGWIPESEWDEARAEAEGRRKPARFLTADEFMDRVEASSPMLKAQLRRSNEEIAGLRKTVDEVSGLLKSQHEMAKAAQLAAYEKGLRQAQEKRTQAITDADLPAAEAAQEEIDHLRDQVKAVDEKKPEESDDKTADINPETRAWVAANRWFTTDAVRNAYMIEVHKEVVADGEWGNGVDSLEEAKRRVVEKFPEKFGINRNRETKPAVLTPSGGSGGSKAGDVDARFAALPAEHRADYERHRVLFEKDGKTKYSKADFLEAYGT